MRGQLPMDIFMYSAIAVRTCWTSCMGVVTCLSNVQVSGLKNFRSTRTRLVQMPKGCLLFSSCLCVLYGSRRIVSLKRALGQIYGRTSSLLIGSLSYSFITTLKTTLYWHNLPCVPFHFIEKTNTLKVKPDQNECKKREKGLSGACNWFPRKHNYSMLCKRYKATKKVECMRMG